MHRHASHFFLLPGFLVLTLAGCKQDYSPNTYASNAAQEEANVQRGIIIGVRQVMISADGTVGAATGGAVGGVAGAQVAGSPVVTALSAIGGSLAGGVGGAAAAHVVADTKGWEYIVQETGDKLVSVTQTSKVSLPIGLHVLVIAGTQQARIVPDYTVQVAAAAPGAAPNKPATASDSTDVEIHIDPVLPDTSAVAPFDMTPATPTNESAPPPAPNPVPVNPAAGPLPPSSPSSGAAKPAGSTPISSPATPAAPITMPGQNSSSAVSP
jgi:outer membrane lipoprotein SlyB